MSKCIIGLGKCSSLYINILLAAIFKFLRDCLLNFNSISSNIKLNIFGFEPILSLHVIITNIYEYLSYILIGLIFLYISNKKSIGEKQKIKKIENLEPNRISLIYYDRNDIDNKEIPLVILISAIFVFHSDLITILYLFDFSDFDIWTFDIIFILFFMNKYFEINIYKHQKFALYFICIASTFFIFLSMFFPKYKNNNSFKYIYNLVGNIYFCFLIFFGFIMISFITDFGRVLTKVLMDLKFISPYIIIICTGIIGFIINSLILFFVSKHSCDQKTILKNACLAEYENEKYFDNISGYFFNLTESIKKKEPPETGYTSKIKFYVEMLAIVPLFLVFSYFEFYFELKIINYLDPNYLLFRDTFYYGLSKIANLGINSNKINNKVSLILLEIAEIIAILGYSVYLEIIELRFCGLDKKLKRKLAEKANLESQTNIINIEEMENSDDEEDKEDNNEKIPLSNL